MRILLTLLFLLISVACYAEIRADVKDQAILSIALKRGVSVDSLYHAIDQGDLDSEIEAEYEAVKEEIRKAWMLDAQNNIITDDLILQRFKALNNSFD